MLGKPGAVTVTADAAAALTGARFVFSAIRVGGDAGRVIDEDVALRRGLVGQETTGAGGCAMALRTIPVVLSYCELLASCSPGAVLINFTNPAGLITQAITQHSRVAAVGVCDTPSGAAGRLAQFLGVPAEETAIGYGGLNHLGWITSVVAAGTDRLGELLARYEELQRFDDRFAAFDPALVRRLGAIPTEYVYYFYDPRRYVDAVARAGASRGADVARLNAELLAAIGKALDGGDAGAAWAGYTRLMGLRHDTYMRTDTGAESRRQAPAHRAGTRPAPAAAGRPGGYEGVALAVIDGLTGRRPGRVIVNTPNGTAVPFLDPGDVVEVPALVDDGGVAPLAAGGNGAAAGAMLPRSAQGLIMCVKEYEREVVGAAVSGDAGRAALALALHPLVPGVTVAKEMMREYTERHGPHLAYLR
jgi:6-phospho-beta-glucosidase